MKYIKVGGTDLVASNIIMGCMRIKHLATNEEIEKLIRTAMDEGINFFDHANVYGGGSCESRFADALALDKNPSLREKIIIQTKCGLIKGCYNFDKDHILESVDASLKRLKTDYLDILLLHRPDPLMDPEEVAEAFDILHQSGKVRYFGVSNQNPMQMELMQKYLKQKLVANQLQASVVHTYMVDSGVSANTHYDQAIDRTGSVMEYCRLKDITIQAWSPFQSALYNTVYLGDREHYPELNDVIDRLAKQYGVTGTAIAVSWLTRMPAGIQVILGTTNIQRLKDGCVGSDLPLTRYEWYELYKAAGNVVP